MRYPLILLSFLLIIPVVSISAQSSTDESTYWQQKNIEAKTKNSEMRKSYYEKYKAKGYDVSSITSDLLDATQTDEGKFWDALKKVQNAYEMNDRKAYVEKFKSKGIDVSGFTDDIMNDSGKFWELVKKLQSNYEQAQNASWMKQKEEKNALEAKQKEAYLKEKEAKMKSEEARKEAMNSLKKEWTNSGTKIDTMNTQNKTQNATTTALDRAKKLFIERLDKVPEDEQEDVFAKLEKNISKQLETARKRNSKATIMKLEAFLEILTERMDWAIDDESLVNSLF